MNRCLSKRISYTFLLHGGQTGAWEKAEEKAECLWVLTEVLRVEDGQTWGLNRGKRQQQQEGSQ